VLSLNGQVCSRSSKKTPIGSLLGQIAKPRAEKNQWTPDQCSAEAATASIVDSQSLSGDGAMRELGQFLAGPGSMLNEPSRFLMFGLMALFMTLTLSAVLLRSLAADISTIRLLVFIPLIAVVSILAVIVFQSVAEHVYLDGLRHPHLATFAGRNVKQVIGRVIFYVLAYIIGWGYSKSLEPCSFLEHLCSFTLGIGVLEELVKALAGVFFFSVVLKHHDHSVRRMALGFTLAGLSFGAGEAAFYFQVYSGMDSELSTYLVRATWCVLLHGTWSLLPVLVLGVCDSMVGLDEQSDAVCSAVLVGSFLPSVLLHGIYDACCLHSEAAMWEVGGLCLVVGFLGVGFIRALPDPSIERLQHEQAW
jgi:hypothetical protein